MPVCSLVFNYKPRLFFCGIKNRPMYQVHTRRPVHHTSWKSCDISHTRQEFDCISHLCLSERKKSRSSGVCVRAWTIQFMKHVLPRFINPRKPAGTTRTDKEGLWEQRWKRGLNMLWFMGLAVEGVWITTEGMISVLCNDLNFSWGGPKKKIRERSQNFITH